MANNEEAAPSFGVSSPENEALEQANVEDVEDDLSSLSASGDEDIVKLRVGSRPVKVIKVHKNIIAQTSLFFRRAVIEDHHRVIASSDPVKVVAAYIAWLKHKTIRPAPKSLQTHALGSYDFFQWHYLLQSFGERIEDAFFQKAIELESSIRSAEMNIALYKTWNGLGDAATEMDNMHLTMATEMMRRASSKAEKDRAVLEMRWVVGKIKEGREVRKKRSEAIEKNEKMGREAREMQDMVNEDAVESEGRPEKSRVDLSLGEQAVEKNLAT